MNRQWGAFHLQCLRMPTHITTIGLHTQARDQTSGLCNRIENKLWLSFSLTHTHTDPYLSTAVAAKECQWACQLFNCCKHSVLCQHKLVTNILIVLYVHIVRES